MFNTPLDRDTLHDLDSFRLQHAIDTANPAVGDTEAQLNRIQDLAQIHGLDQIGLFMSVVAMDGLRKLGVGRNARNANILRFIADIFTSEELPTRESMLDKLNQQQG